VEDAAHFQLSRAHFQHVQSAYLGTGTAFDSNDGGTK
jgi:hypothetical protein